MRIPDLSCSLLTRPTAPCAGREPMGAHPKTQSQNTNVQEYKEGHEMKILLGAMLLLIVGCTGVAHAERSATNDTEDRIAALEEHIRILYEEAVVHEEHILALEARADDFE